MPGKKRRHGLEAEPWAILPSALHRLLAWDRGEVTIEAMLDSNDPLVAAAGAPAAPRTGGAIAVIPVTGVIEHHSDWLMELFGGTAADTLAAEFRSAMADADVRAIVLDIDSPGGTTAGIPELAAEIREARGGDKPIVAVANAMAASAAYWLASQADEIVVTPSAQVGSIGVYAMHQDISGALAQEGIDITLISAGPHKTDGNMFEPLSEDARADLQGRVNETYRQFVADVAAGRRVPTKQVEADFGGGRIMSAKNAVKAGLADRVDSLDATLARLGKRRYQRSDAAAAVPAGGVLAAVPTVTVSTGTAANGTGDYIQVVGTGTGGSVTIHDAMTQDGMTLGEELAQAAGDLAALVERATTRAALRESEGRPAYSTTTERSLRTIRDAIDALLATEDPEASAPPADDPPAPPAVADVPPPVEPVMPPAAVAPSRPAFRSREDWLQFVRNH